MHAAHSRRLTGAPPASFFVGSAIVHYLGPAFAVLLFLRVEPLSVAWLRIVIGVVVLTQVPSATEGLAVGIVVAAVAIHREGNEGEAPGRTIAARHAREGRPARRRARVVT
jgi:threonine/homoserine efflux transporter RhtA